MSTLKVNKIENTASTDGGIEIDSDGHVQLDGLQFPTVGALSNRNLIINGAMQVAQRSTSETVSNNSNEGYSTLDRWFLLFNDAIAGAVTFEQSTDSPAGFKNSAKITCSTEGDTFDGNEYVALNQRIEAQNLQLLNYGSSDAVTMTLSWYMKTTSYTGPISVTLMTSDGTSEYFSVSVTPTNSWAKYTLTIPGSTSATINDDTGRGMTVGFALAGYDSSTIASSTDSTAWSTTRADFRTDVGNILSSTSNSFFLTGVQLEVGSVATPFEHRSYGDELARCLRYYYKPDTEGSAKHAMMGISYSADSYYIPFQFPVPMRAAPSVVAEGGGNWRSRTNNNNNFDVTWTTHGTTSTTNCTLQTSGGSIATGTPFWFETHDTSGCNLEISAEL